MSQFTDDNYKDQHSTFHQNELSIQKQENSAFITEPSFIGIT